MGKWKWPEWLKDEPELTNSKWSNPICGQPAEYSVP